MSWRIGYIIFLLMAFQLFAMSENPYSSIKKKETGIQYVKKDYVLLHTHPSINSEILTTVTCEHSVKTFHLDIPADAPLNYNVTHWTYVVVGPYQGFIKKLFLSSEKEKCYSSKYPKFYDKLGLDISTMYYLGRLNDFLIEGRSSSR